MATNETVNGTVVTTFNDGSKATNVGDVSVCTGQHGMYVTVTDDDGMEHVNVPTTDLVKALVALGLVKEL